MTQNYMRCNQRALVTIARAGAFFDPRVVKYRVWNALDRHPAGSWTDKREKVEFRTRYYWSAQDVKYAAEKLGYSAKLTLETSDNRGSSN